MATLLRRLLTGGAVLVVGLLVNYGLLPSTYILSLGWMAVVAFAVGFLVRDGTVFVLIPGIYPLTALLIEGLIVPAEYDGGKLAGFMLMLLVNFPILGLIMSLAVGLGWFLGDQWLGRNELVSTGR